MFNCYQPIPPDTVFKFFGANVGETDAEVQQQQFERNKKVFYGVDES